MATRQSPISVPLDGGQDSHTQEIRVQAPSMRLSQNTRFTEVPGTVVGRPTKESLPEEAGMGDMAFVVRRANQAIGIHSRVPAEFGNLSSYSDAMGEVRKSEDRQHVQPYRVTGSRVPPLPNDYETFVPSSYRRTITVGGESKTFTLYAWAESILTSVLAGTTPDTIQIRVVDEDGAVVYRDEFTQSGSTVDASRYGMWVLPARSDGDSLVGWRIFWTETTPGREIKSRKVRYNSGSWALDAVVTHATGLTATFWHVCESQADSAEIYWLVYATSTGVILQRANAGAGTSATVTVRAGANLLGAPAVAAGGDEVCIAFITATSNLRAAIYEDDAGIASVRAEGNVIGTTIFSPASSHTYVRAAVCRTGHSTTTWVCAGEHSDFALGADTFGDDAQYGVAYVPLGASDTRDTRDIPNVLLYGHAAPGQLLLYTGGLADEPTDQTVLGYEMNANFRLAPVYRVGTDILEGMFAALGSGLWQEALRNSGRDVVGTEIRVCYHQRTEFAGTGFPAPRESFVNTAPRHLPYTERNGVVSLATAYPRDLDGYVTLESGAVAAPRVRAEAVAGGGSTNWTNGTYAIVAILAVTDHQGSVRRSAPSVPFEITLSGEYANVEISVIWNHLDGIAGAGEPSELEVEVYASSSGAPYVRVSQNPVPLVTTVTYGYWQATNLARYQDATVPLYTEGGVFPAGVVPAMRDVATIRDRDWCIPAELPEYVYYAKPYEFEIMSEWTAAQNIYIPGGQNVAIAELRGQPVIFKGDAIYTVYGDGPSGNGAGQQFGLPVKVADVGCADQATVVTAPGGVYFLSSRGMIERLLPDMSTVEPIGLPVRDRTAAGQYTRAVYQGDEIVWLSDVSPTRTMCYNLVASRWSEWTATVDDGIVGPDGTIWYADGGSMGALRGTATLSTELQTAWIQLGGEHGSGHIDEIWLLAERISAHDVTVTLRYDYETSGGQVVSFTDAEIAADLKPDETLYTLVIRPDEPKVRAVQVTVEKTSGNTDAMHPLSATVHWRADAGGMERAVGATVRK